MGEILSWWRGGGSVSRIGGVKSAYACFTPELIWRGEYFSHNTPAIICQQFRSPLCIQSFCSSERKFQRGNGVKAGDQRRTRRQQRKRREKADQTQHTNILKTLHHIGDLVLKKKKVQTSKHVHSGSGVWHRDGSRQRRANQSPCLSCLYPLFGLLCICFDKKWRDGRKQIRVIQHHPSVSKNTTETKKQKKSADGLGA